jgi:hypothetical protein
LKIIDFSSVQVFGSSSWYNKADTELLFIVVGKYRTKTLNTATQLRDLRMIHALQTKYRKDGKTMSHKISRRQTRQNFEVSTRADLNSMKRPSTALADEP